MLQSRRQNADVVSEQRCTRADRGGASILGVVVREAEHALHLDHVVRANGLRLLASARRPDAEADRQRDLHVGLAVSHRGEPVDDEVAQRQVGLEDLDDPEDRSGDEDGVAGGVRETDTGLGGELLDHGGDR